MRRFQTLASAAGATLLIMFACSCGKPAADSQQSELITQQPVELSLDHPETATINNWLNNLVESERAWDPMTAMLIADDAQLLIHWRQDDGRVVDQTIAGLTWKRAIVTVMPQLKVAGYRCVYTDFSARVIDAGVEVTSTCIDEKTRTKTKSTWVIAKDEGGFWKLRGSETTLAGKPLDLGAVDAAYAAPPMATVAPKPIDPNRPMTAEEYNRAVIEQREKSQKEQLKINNARPDQDR